MNETMSAIETPSILQQNQIDPKTADLLRAWVWQMMLPLGGQSDFIGEHGFDDESVANLLQATQWFSDADAYEPVAARAHMKKHFLKWQKTIQWDEVYQNGVAEVLQQNIQAWQQLLGLNAVESKILTFVILMYQTNVLSQAAQFMGELNSRQVV